MTVNLEPQTFDLTTAALKHFNCSKCKEDKACVVKLEDQLVCVNCRYKEIGKAALYEGLYNGMD